MQNSSRLFAAVGRPRVPIGRYAGLPALSLRRSIATVLSRRHPSNSLSRTWTVCVATAAYTTSTTTASSPGNENGRSERTTSGPSSTTDAEDGADDVNPVVRACKWNSPAYVERLGFTVGQSFTETQLRAHFKVLAKHFHPDSAADSADATAAFQNIKEAYDALLEQVKAQGGQYRGVGGTGPGFEYSDEARRRSQMKALGDGVFLFLIMTLILIVVVARYSKERLNSRYLTALLTIFFLIQLFPRLLAAAILYACHVSYVIQNAELKEQAAVSLVVSQAGHDESIACSLQGIDPAHAVDVIVQAEVSVVVEGEVQGVNTVATTVTFDKGVTTFLVPVPSGKPWQIHLKAHDERRRQVLVDRIVPSVQFDELQLLKRCEA